MTKASTRACLLALVFGCLACSDGTSTPGARGDSATAGKSGIAGGLAPVTSSAGVGQSTAPTGRAGVGATGSAGVQGAIGAAGGSTGTVTGGAGATLAGRSGANAGANAAAGAGGAIVGSAGAAAVSGGQGGIWMPKPGVTWQWQLTGKLDTSVDAQMYDIDLFDNDTATITALHQAGRHVVCYFSAGSYEPDRPDSDALSKTGLGSTLDGWPDEKWLDIRSSAVRDIMKARLDLAQSKGCDGVEPDNVDGFDNSNGLDLTQQDQLDYNQFLATEGHARNLSVGLKNCLGLVPQLVGKFDWALNEECLKYDECSDLEPFISADKAVFHCEYAKTTSGICDKRPQGFSTIVKDLDLDAFRLACP